jgi:hypothetical protein
VIEVGTKLEGNVPECWDDGRLREHEAEQADAEDEKGPRRRSLLNTSSKARLNLLSRSWIRNRIGVGRSASDQASLRAC